MSSCPKCGSQMNFVQQYSQWYCNRCQQYQQPPQPVNQPPNQYGQHGQQPQPVYQRPQHPGQHQAQPAPVQGHYQQPAYGAQGPQPVPPHPQQPSQPGAYQQQPAYGAQGQQPSTPRPQQPAQPYAAHPAPQPQGGYQQPPTGPNHPAAPQPANQPPNQYGQQPGGYPAQQYQQPYNPQAKLENEISQAPSFSVIVFHMKHGQSVTAEAGAMMFMHNTLDIDTHGRKGGVLKGLATSAFGGESFFVNTYTAARGPGDLALVGPVMGDIKPIELHQGMILQSGAFLASDPSVGLDTKWQGLKGFLTDRDFIMLHATGPGTVWVASFGAIIERDLRPGEVLSVDTGHIVAFPDTMQFGVRRIGNWKSTILSGEGLVTDFQGPGKILMQTRHLPAFAEQLIPYLPNQR